MSRLKSLCDHAEATKFHKNYVGLGNIPTKAYEKIVERFGIDADISELFDVMTALRYGSVEGILCPD